MKKKIAGKIILALLVLVLVGLGLIYILPGYNLYVVRSESMVPTINMGDIIITGPVKDTLEAGQIITYERNDALITHRVKSVNETTLVTQGDAVEDPDPWIVKTSDVRGTYLFKIPYVGYVTRFIQTKVGWIISIIIPALVLVIWLAKDIVKEALKSDA
jgi:signal peptidase I